MLIALENNLTLVEASRNLCKEQTYHCPACKSPVHLKIGQVMRPHFAHYQKSACATFSEGETDEHIQGKQQLKDWLTAKNIQVELEAYLPELKQRPDLLVTHNQQKIALEFQCSAIPIHKVVERTDGYLEHGYLVFWILGENFPYKNQLTAFQKSCLSHLGDQLVLFHYSVSKKRLDYRYGFMLQQNQKMEQGKRTMRHGQAFNYIFDKKKVKEHKEVNVEMEHMKLLRQLNALDFRNHFLQLLCNRKDTLISMPKEVYHVVPHEWMIQTNGYLWKMVFIYWLEQKGVKAVLTKKQLLTFSEAIPYYAMRQMTLEQRLLPLLEFVEVLRQVRSVTTSALDKWTIEKTPERYQYLEEKFK